MASSQILIPPYDQKPLEKSLTSNRSLQLNGDLYKATDKTIFSSLIENVHDIFMPPKFAPNELTSAPIAVPDRFATHRDPKATVLACVINGLMVAAIIWMGGRHMSAVVAPVPAKVVTLVTPVVPAPPLPKAPPKSVVMSGGGGQPMPRPVARGNPPKLEVKPVLLAATTPPKIAPRLAVAPTLNVQPDLKMAKADVPMIGMSNAAPAVTVSMGNGAGAGLGAGVGNGMGAGTGGNYGGGVFKVGGGVSKPEVISAPDPAFTEEARQAKVTGKVVVYLQVNAQGQPMHVKVIRGLGMGLDEKALEAVRQYRFKPALKDGHPVTVEMNVEVNFQIL